MAFHPESWLGQIGEGAAPSAGRLRAAAGFKGASELCATVFDYFSISHSCAFLYSARQNTSQNTHIHYTDNKNKS